MYTAINENIIVEKALEQVTASGIHLAEQDEGAVFEFTVVSTTAQTRALQDKVIFAERRHCFELPKKDGRRFASLSGFVAQITFWPE